MPIDFRGYPNYILIISVRGRLFLSGITITRAPFLFLFAVLFCTPAVGQVAVNGSKRSFKKRLYVPVRVHSDRIRQAYAQGRLRMSPSVQGAVSADSTTMWIEKPEPRSWTPPRNVPHAAVDLEVRASAHAAVSDPESPRTLTLSFDAISFDTEAPLSGLYHIPPDAHVAAGPDQIVVVVNAAVEWYSTSGAGQNSQSLKSFFQSLTPVAGLFDPKVIYDQIDGRFVLIVLEKGDTSDGDAVNSSRILVAVSNTSDPNGVWTFQSIDSMLSIEAAPRWADYPGLAVDSDVIYITANMFTFGDGTYGGTRVWIISKLNSGVGLYSGGQSVFSVSDPFGASGTSSLASTLQPSHVFLPGPPAGTGTWLVAYGGLSSSSSEFLQAIRVDSPTSSPTFVSNLIPLGDIDDTALALPDAEQSGTSTRVLTNSRRTLNAVLRNDQLYGTATLRPSPGNADAGEATAFWFRVDVSNPGFPALVESVQIGGEDISSGTYTFFSSIAVNGSGDVAVGYSASGPSIFPGAYVSGRLSTDPAGVMQSATTLRAGLDYYIRVFGSTNRWGDYSGIALDPDDDAAFWVFNEYALTRGSLLGNSTDDGRWGTVVGRFSMMAPPLVAATQPGVSLKEGQQTSVDLTTIFSGGSGSLTYSAVSSADQHITTSLTGTVLISDVIEAYFAGTTIDSVSVTATATDESADTASSVLVVDVLPVTGDLDGSGGPSAYSAARALDAFLGLISLTDKQLVAADYDTDGDVDALDAFLIWQASMPPG
jgi:hypothetical protein